jgi:hypothetical protein
MASNRNPPVRPPSVTLDAWLQFEDAHAHFDDASSTVVTDHRTYEESGEWDDIGWEREEWEIRSVIIPLSANAKEVLRSLDHIQRYHIGRTTFSVGWEGEKFSFADGETAYGLVIRPWLMAWTHPVTGVLEAEANRDFARYHLLDEQGTRNEREYFHPIERVRIARLAVVVPAPLRNPAVHFHVQRDFLRDFLTAREAAMCISVVGDRFAIVGKDAGFELVDKEYEVSPNISMHRVVQRTRIGNVQARSTLYQTAIIEPYSKPRRSRTAWPYYGSDDEDVPNPTFIAEDGTRRPAAEFGRRYLYFRPAALEHYFSAPGHSVEFHMRTWGSANGPAESSVAVGINEKGLLTIFAPLMAKLSSMEQTHWAPYSAAPDGGPCAEWFQTQMMQDPPHSPSVNELIDSACGALDVAWKGRFGILLFRERAEPTDEAHCRDRARMSVGPISGQFDEVLRLSKALYESAVDTIDFESVRKPLTAAGVPFPVQGKQLALLRLVLTQILKFSDDDAKKVLSPLYLVNSFRIASAHTLPTTVPDTMRAAGIKPASLDPRSAWDALVDSVVVTLQEIATIVTHHR